MQEYSVGGVSGAGKKKLCGGARAAFVEEANLWMVFAASTGETPANSRAKTRTFSPLQSHHNISTAPAVGLGDREGPAPVRVCSSVEYFPFLALVVHGAA
jgi:hypothetical protein